jgi:transposase-like protein
MDGKHTTKPITTCPYCEGADIVKAGTRANKHGPVQLYACTFCNRKFTPLTTKYRTYPMRVIIETLSRYNRLHSLSDVQTGIRRKFGIRVPSSTARRWITEFAPYLPFLRLRDAAKRYQP